MGFVRGKKVRVIKNAPLKDPVEYNVMGYSVSLSRNEAGLIEVITPEEVQHKSNGSTIGSLTDEAFQKTAKITGKNIRVALVGNPNSGKTLLFNFLLLASERVGNYSGVTIESKEATFIYKGYTFHIADLPGTYSLTAYTPE